MLISSKVDQGINGNIKIPGDKSISHRSIIIPSISKGISEISNLLLSDDVINTLKAFENMGVRINKVQNNYIIEGRGLNSLKMPKNKIYLGNSGTSARLLTGLLSCQNFNSVIVGDQSLSQRPMKRIIDPLELMNGKFKSNNGSLPLYIYGQKLRNIDYELTLPSAQVKSGIILAALNTKGETKIIENHITRNHTEIMLKAFGGNIESIKKDNITEIKIIGKKELKSRNISVPSDLSSSAFFIVAALLIKNSKILLENININPTRDGILRALKLMGGNIKILNKRIINEEIVADLKIESSQLNGCELDEKMSKLMIDEYPILAIAASFANSPSLFKGLNELKIKESDRLNLIEINLKNCGVFCEVKNNQLFINPLKNSHTKNNKIRTDFDHRIAMAFSIMGSLLKTDLHIKDSESIKTSFPNFIEKFNKAGGKLRESK